MPEVRLIDANALHAKIYEDSERSYGASANIAQVLLRIETAPTIEPKLRHGDWNTIYSFDGDVYFRCSNCEEEFVLDDGNPKSKGWKYCPSCGCKMDGGADNG